MVKPHYMDLVESSELGEKLAEIMTRTFYNLVDTPFKNLGDHHGCSAACEIREIGRLKQQMTDQSHTYLGEEIYKDAILELTERIDDIITENKINDGNHFQDCSNYAALINRYLGELKYARQAEDFGRTMKSF
ncbi:MAG: hypothetical protein ABIF85_01455 [Nanoarchaeota archaeon]|nr:hypothetical protein [Nanoarchaeota archaeon]MBU4299754.1 hypothetical protein [Nanoarchaeota archaeon]MBU4452568.1 hypothetical protein [Nanoarchaeota archaeon]MCG2723533.1 hypothetical protein [archaeon]